MDILLVLGSVGGNRVLFRWFVCQIRLKVFTLFMNEVELVGSWDEVVTCEQDAGRESHIEWQLQSFGGVLSCPGPCGPATPTQKNPTKTAPAARSGAAWAHRNQSLVLHRI